MSGRLESLGTQTKRRQVPLQAFCNEIGLFLFPIRLWWRREVCRGCRGAAGFREKPQTLLFNLTSLREHFSTWEIVAPFSLRHRHLSSVLKGWVWNHSGSYTREVTARWHFCLTLLKIKSTSYMVCILFSYFKFLKWKNIWIVQRCFAPIRQFSLWFIEFCHFKSLTQ